ncbi:hypothetical protein [Aquitalea pelogenes]|uniref:hypothetical protein n=1 Tax=Aquitalea pelogenes TaxID=1293573 RepID=UPI0035B261EE
MNSQSSELKVQQVNCFYNYTIGLDVTEIDLLKTASKLLKSGIARTICFSDLKAIYLDRAGKFQVEWLKPEGRKWDSHWTVGFSESLPKQATADLVFCLELSFHERQIEGSEARHIPAHLRTALQPFVLERDGLFLPIYPWLKIYSDGVMSISFQLDTTWDDLPEADFIQNIVNLSQCYFDRIWMQAEIQRMDGEQALLDAFEAEISIGGQSLLNRKTRKAVRAMRRSAKAELDNSLKKEGRSFELHGERWCLHQIAGTEDQDKWEATIDLCRSMYTTALTSQIVVKDNRINKTRARVKLWQGRPSISLVRFANQPQEKNVLLEKFGPSLSRILMRTPFLDNPPILPTDLRLFEDYCFHGNRAILLWTWTRPSNSPQDAWRDSNTRPHLLENQARAEHFEYHNMRIARASAIASSPPSDEHLIHAYETLSVAELVIHQSSQAGEITDALDYLIETAGTTRLIASGKEQARWHLDERRLRIEKRQSRLDRWLSTVFGFVGAAGLADLVVKPLIKATYSTWADWVIGLIAFGSASLAVGVLAIFMLLMNHIRNE